MKRYLYIIIWTAAAFLPAALPAGAQPSLPAFPGAEGFGAMTSGGRGGRVCHVTTLDDGPQPGTLRHALAQRGPRTVVFDVAGTILLSRPLRIVHGDLTLAGQSAPGEGICIAGEPVLIRADNVIIRYLRFRVGNACGGEPDGLSCSDGRRVIIDHCTISWSVDECCSVYGGEEVTVQWCLISESLRDAGHHKGAHGYGAIWGGAGATFHHNLVAHHESRTPRLGPHKQTQEREWMEMVNNVIYNWAGAGCYGGEGMQANIVANYYKPGPATPRDRAVGYRLFCPGVRTTDYCTNSLGEPNVWKPMEHVWGRYYVADNVMEGDAEVTADNWTRGVYAQIDTLHCDDTWNERTRRAIRLDTPLAAPPVTTQRAEEAYRAVLAGAGCAHRRDALDRRVVREVRSGRAACRGSVSADADLRPGLIDHPLDARAGRNGQPWPRLKGKPSKRLKDSDGDGMPDRWERARGLDPADPADGGATTLSPEGYTNLECYLNELVK